MSRQIPNPVPSSGDEFCLQFLAGPGRFSAAELKAVRNWWRANCRVGEDLVAFFTRQGVVHDQSAAQIERIERGQVSFTLMHHLFSPGGLDRLRELSKHYPDSAAPEPDTRSPRKLVQDSSPDAAAEPESPGTQLLATLPIVRRQPDGELAAHSAELPAGTIIGPLRLVRQIGRGNKGVVYEAQEVLLNRRVAVKVLAPEMAARGPAWAERFLQEARLASRVEHPSILSVWSVGRDDGLVWYAMPLMKSGSAKDMLQAAGPFCPIEATRIVCAAARALAAAHTHGLSHGNLKPSNVFVGDGGTVKIADFAVPHLPLESTGSGRENGGPMPELREQDIAKDLRDLGATYHWLLTGTQPVRGEEGQGALPESCGRIVAAAMSLRQSHGFASSAEMADALADAEEELRSTDTLRVASLKQAIDGRPERLMPRAQVGMRLGKCVLTEQLGQGSSGVVFRARHSTLNISVAVKVLRAGGDRALYRQLKSEAHLLAQINHPHIVRVWDFEDDPDLPYLVMELVEGPSLAEVIRRGGQLRAEPAALIVAQVASALAAAQKIGIVHRDVKPGNILLARDSNSLTKEDNGEERKKGERVSRLPPSVFPLRCAKLADLGLAVFVDPAGGNSSAPGNAGTVAYMPPEMARGAGEADHRGDIYSLGATFYHMVTGCLPFPGASRAEVILKHAKSEPQSPHELAPDLPLEVSAVILKMLAKDPARRYQSYDELLQALADIAPGLPGVSGIRPSA